MASGHVWQGACIAGVCVVGGVCGREVNGRGHAWQGVMQGRVALLAGACMAGGVHGRGHAWWGTCMMGVCMAGETATAADGMHPTGMHSCMFIKVKH